MQSQWATLQTGGVFDLAPITVTSGAEGGVGGLF